MRLLTLLPFWTASSRCFFIFGFLRTPSALSAALLVAGNTSIFSKYGWLLLILGQVATALKYLANIS